DLGPLQELAEAFRGVRFTSLVRRAQAIMPPRFTTMWLNRSLERVLDPALLTLLRTPYQKGRDARVEQDYNLNTDRWRQVAQVVEVSLWPQRCQHARNIATKLLREQSKLPEIIRTCADTVKHNAARVAQQFHTRIGMAAGPQRS